MSKLSNILEGITTFSAAIDFLEDGAAMAEMGITDKDQKEVERTHALLKKERRYWIDKELERRGYVRDSAAKKVYFREGESLFFLFRYEDLGDIELFLLENER